MVSLLNQIARFAVKVKNLATLKSTTLTAPFKNWGILFLLGLICNACMSVPRGSSLQPTPPPPDYSQVAYWAALPTIDDQADRTPIGMQDQQATAMADVFYVHPTIYTKTRKGNSGWNASLADERLNADVDDAAMLNQASIFNAAGRVYAPRYRQAHLGVFRQRGTVTAEGALDLAYTDVLAAFNYFLDNYNDGRPIIIVGHSQGTVHTARLIAERIDNAPTLRSRLVAAYLIGMPIPTAPFANVPLCQSATETGCFVSWRTYRNDYQPTARDTFTDVAVVNPLNWSTAEGRVPASANAGGVLYKFDKILPGLVSAEVRGPRLYTNKPKFFGDILFNRKDYHIGDLNLFWVNVRENAVNRVNAYLE